jgi:hypothetical protein
VDYSVARTRQCEADETFADVLDFAEERYSGEFSYSEVETRAHAATQWPAFRSLCLARMRTGFRKAYRKWEHKGRFAANRTFWAVADAVSPHTQHIEYVGQTFKLTYGDGVAHCEPDYDMN